MTGPVEPLVEAPKAPDPSSTGLDPTLAALLAYLMGPFTGLLFLFVEGRSLFVRFHAMQSTIAFLGLGVAWLVAGVIPLLGPLLQFLLWLAGLVAWILLMVKAFQGEWYKLPVVGDLAEERTRLPG